MSIIKKFKDYFTKDDKSQAEKDFSSTLKKRGYRDIISFDTEALEEMEDKVRDIFFGPIEDCDEFEISYQSSIEGSFMELRFRYHDLLYKFKSKSDEAIKIEKDVNRSIKKLIIEYNTKDNRAVNVDAPEFLFYNNNQEIYKTAYVLKIWRYRQPGESYPKDLSTTMRVF
jgi:hypothetical protein